MRSPLCVRLALSALFAATASCSDAAPSLPPIPLVEGRLSPRVVHPPAGALVAARRRAFVLGSLGNGHARLTINGARVPVHPNGSFLAYLPLPDAASPAYQLVAVLGADTARLTHPVRLLPPALPVRGDGPLVVDSASLTPTGPLVLQRDERVRVSIRAPSNVRAWVQWPGGRRQLLVNDAAAAPGSVEEDTAGGAAALADAGAAVSSGPPGDATLWAGALPARMLQRGARLIVARGADTLHFDLPRLGIAEDTAASWVAIGRGGTPAEADQSVVARPTPAGTYRWFLLPGTRLQMTGRVGDFVRVRLDSLLDVWVSAADAHPLPAGLAPRPRVALDARVIPAAEWVDFVVPTGERPPFLVEEEGNQVVLTLYGTQAATSAIRYVASDSFVKLVRWTPVSSERVRFTLDLSSGAFGYATLWSRGAFVLRLRRPPRVDRRTPLGGLVIAVDPGHPPLGTVGPTGLTEPEVTLAVGRRLAALLERRGARVIMTRATADPVALEARPLIAARANAHALVSIHVNAPADGANPFEAAGTGTYFFHPQAEPLARAIQRGLVRRLGLADLGVYYDNLAVTRPTWMPAVLCEGASIIIPRQEAALRTPEFQEAYARGVADGLEAYFRSLARR